MAESALRRPDRRPLARVPDRACSRPSCPAPAVATLSMQYGEQHSRLTDLTVEASPERYDLCGAHADRTRPPRGWTLDDDRSDDPVLPSDPPGPRSVDDTVALLAAALRDDTPDDTSDEVAAPVVEVAPTPVPEPALFAEPAPVAQRPEPDDMALPGTAPEMEPAPGDAFTDAMPVGRRVPAASRDGAE